MLCGCFEKIERRVEYSAAGVAYISPEGELYCNENNVMLAIESAIRERGASRGPGIGR